MKKPQTNHHPQVQRNKTQISQISSAHVSNLFGFTPTGNIRQFNEFFNNLSENTLCTSDLEQTNIHTFNPPSNHSKEYTQLDYAYNQIITHQDEITNPNIQLCPDFLNQCPITGRINVSEMKAKKIGKNNNRIPSISFNLEQFLKYQIHLADRWDSDFTVVGYLYTLEKDIKTIKDPRYLVKGIKPKNIILIPSDYIIKYCSNFKNALNKFNLDIESIEHDGPNLLNILQTKLQESKYKYNSAYFTIGAQDITDIISNKTTHKVYQQEIEIPKETIRWTDTKGINRWLTTGDQQIQISCVENGKRLDDFFNSITKNIHNIKTDEGLLYNGLATYLESHSPYTQKIKPSLTLSQFS
ncbi:MAG: hypothetical protein GQ477_03680 [Nanohaloarchaea archaeon]|nr:hypothetical protein [Candidatus Nanohaloarchaea archaeon]